MSEVQPTPRHFHSWAEEDGDVLWYRHPISEPPYFGSPVCLGRTMLVEIYIGREQFEFPAQQTGGWPFDEDDEQYLWWIPAPNGNAVQAAIDAALKGEG
ncbi:hypothetical protein [Sphingobium sp. YR768]|uniref:hypothetical protein n=1 Tax=Sphingobium sp. YR768 TaxID=1884365 RepID=UPI0008AF517E|nr:hypothetical protein [Sphingobium sp. YR768]SES02272.1 hypothetical protein SAMN05518866_13151 [Sphingobium sp. YR768]